MNVLIVFNNGKQMQVDTDKDNVHVTDKPMFGLFSCLENHDAVVNWNSVCYATVVDEEGSEKDHAD